VLLETLQNFYQNCQKKNLLLKEGMANSMHNWNTNTPKKAFWQQKLNPLLCYGNGCFWMDETIHPLWNGLRISFWIGWDHSFDWMRPPLWIGWGHPLEWMWSSFRMDDTILVKWEYPCEMDEDILLNGRKTSHPWKFRPVVFRWNILELAEDGWMSLSLIYVFWLLTPSITFTFFGVHKNKLNFKALLMT